MRSMTREEKVKEALEVVDEVEDLVEVADELFSNYGQQGHYT